MISRTVLAVVLLVIATVVADKGYVHFTRDKVTLTCPQAGEWFDGKEKDIHKNSKTYEFTFTGPKEHYRCQYKPDETEEKTTSYYFYIQGKGCKNCFELDALLFAVVIVADMIFTGIVIIMVYKCTKKKTAGPQHAPKAGRSRQENIPLSAQSSDYAPLSHHTRSNDTYSHIHSSTINKTG